MIVVAVGNDKAQINTIRIVPCLTAADVVNRTPERELADLIFQLSDERFSRHAGREDVDRHEAEGVDCPRDRA